MVRPNELSFARRGAIQKLAARHQGTHPGYLTARFIEIDPEDNDRALVAFGDSHVSVPAGPHNIVPGTLVRVAVDSNNAPTYLIGASTTWPEGLDVSVLAPPPVTTMKVLAPETLTISQIKQMQDQVAILQDMLTGIAVELDPPEEKAAVSEIDPDPIVPIEE